MFNMQEYNALGQILDRTFGRGSIGEKGFAIRHNMSLCHITNRPLLELRYETAINFNPRHGIHDQMKLHNKMSQEVLEGLVSQVKSEYREITGKSIKLTEPKMSEPEVITTSHNPSLVRARYSRIMVHYLEQ